MDKKYTGILEGRSDGFSGQWMELQDGQTVWLGSDSNNDVILTENNIAPFHCGISYDAAKGCFWVINEAGYGVSCPGKGALPQGEEVCLHPKEGLQIGSYLFGLEEDVFDTGEEFGEASEFSGASDLDDEKYFSGAKQTSAAIIAAVLLVAGIAMAGILGGSKTTNQQAAGSGTGTVSQDALSAFGNGTANSGTVIAGSGTADDSAAAVSNPSENTTKHKLMKKYTIYVDVTNEENGGECRDAFQSWKTQSFAAFTGDSFYTLTVGTVLFSSGTYAWNDLGSGIILTSSGDGKKLYLDFSKKSGKIGEYLEQKYEIDGKEWTIYWMPGKDDTVSVSPSTTTAQNETEYPETSPKAVESGVPQGTTLEFADAELAHCVMKTAGYLENIKPTDQICQSITKLDTTGYTLSTLEDLEYFPNLEELEVHNSGALGALNLKGINKVPKLKKLTLDRCQLSEIDRIADLTQLEYLDLSGQKTDIQDYSSLAALKNLKYLDLSWSGFEAYKGYHLADASFINSLTALEDLNIHETELGNYSFTALSNLKRLRISRCDINQVLKDLEQSGALEQMVYLGMDLGGDITDSTALTDDSLRNYLSKAVNLEELDMCFSDNTTLQGLGELKKLKKLQMNDIFALKLPISEYDELAKLPMLEELAITYSPGKDGEERQPDSYHFLNNLKSLKKLCIHVYGDMSVDGFSQMPALEVLNLSGGGGSFSTTIDLAGIEKLPSLKEFNYYNIDFKSTAPLDDLDYLTVREAHTGESLEDLANYGN